MDVEVTALHVSSLACRFCIAELSPCDSGTKDK